MPAPLFIALVSHLALSLSQASPPPDSQGPAVAPVQAPPQAPTQPPAPAPAPNPTRVTAPGAVQAQPLAPPPEPEGETSEGPATDGQTAGGQPAGPQPLDNLVRAPVVRPFEMPAYAPRAPMTYDAPPPVPTTQSVTVENYRHSYEGPETEEQRFYQSGISSHFHIEQSMLGPMDGVWVVSDRAGRAIFSVVLNDVNGSQMEGAWRDRRESGPFAMGVLNTVTHDRSKLTLTFHKPTMAYPSVLRLKLQADGRWSGEIDDGGAQQSVVMNRQPATPEQP